MHESLLETLDRSSLGGSLVGAGPSLSGWRPVRALLGRGKTRRLESEPQRQQRVASHLHDRIVARLAMDLPGLAAEGIVPCDWFTPETFSAALETSRYWLRHPEPLAAFLSAEHRSRLTGAALALCAGENPAGWWRDRERYRCALTTDWAGLARQTADRLQAEQPQEQRTALFSGPDEASIIFANEDPSSPIATDEQIAGLRRDLRAAGFPELGFSHSEAGGAWVMLVWAKDEERLQKVLYCAWEQIVGIDR